MNSLTKMDVARRQLGTALWLFLEDVDPVSVHTLAAAGGEVAEQLARTAGLSPFMEHIIGTNPDMSAAAFYRLARQHANAFKHSNDRGGRPRNDDDLLQNFEDRQNDALLFVGWSDLGAASGSLPVEAQVFQVWFYACYPQKLARKKDAARFSSVFPEINTSSRAEQKHALRIQIARAKTNLEVTNNSGTDCRPLVWNGENLEIRDES